MPDYAIVVLVNVPKGDDITKKIRSFIPRPLAEGGDGTILDYYLVSDYAKQKELSNKYGEARELFRSLLEILL